MANEKDYQQLLDRLAALRETVTDQLDADLIANPALGDALNKQIDDMQQAITDADMKVPPPPDQGLGQLAGVGPDAASEMGKTRIPEGIEPYDENVASERMVAIGDLYYIFQHEKIGVFRVVQKLKELFNAGAVRLSSGEGAFHLYQFDRREVLRYTRNERISAYRRAFGYGAGFPIPGSTPNLDFHNLYSHFVNQVALYWRDKRISDVVRERAYDPSFGSMAVVRRAGLDLRNNLKFTGFGHVNVMRVEVMQLLDEAFRILNADDVKNLFGVSSAWEAIEEILVRYFNERLVTSPRQRMAVAGREVLRWLAQPHIMKMQRGQFEALLLQIAEYSEEWLTSAQSLGLAKRMDANRVLEYPPVSRNAVMGGRPATRAPRRSRQTRTRNRSRNGSRI
jgi:hypothetical protein